METELRQLQLKSLEILDIMDAICRQHDIKYSLCGGTVVGAHLYKGFLPWDDDIDVMMTREHYNRFLQLAPQCLPEGFSIVNYNTSELGSRLKISFTKIINDNTTFIEQGDFIYGVFIDITVYDKVPETKWKQKLLLFLYKRSQTVNMGRLPGKSLKNMFRNILLSTILSNHRAYMRFFQRVVEHFGKKPGKYTWRELFGAYYFSNMIPFRPSVFEHYTTIEFEGRQFMIVRDFIEYLQVRYNRTDFREPKEKQVPHHIQMVDFNLPYREYMKKKGIPLPKEYKS